MAKWMFDLLCDNKLIYKLTVIIMLVFLSIKTADASYFAIVQTIILSWLSNDQMAFINQFIISSIKFLSGLNCILLVLSLILVWLRNQRNTQTVNNVSKDLFNFFSIISCFILLFSIFYDFVIRSYESIRLFWSFGDYCQYILACSPFVLRFYSDCKDAISGKEIEDGKPNAK